MSPRLCLGSLDNLFISAEINAYVVVYPVTGNFAAVAGRGSSMPHMQIIRDAGSSSYALRVTINANR
jgi:hypothetical protein